MQIKKCLKRNRYKYEKQSKMDLAIRLHEYGLPGGWDDKESACNAGELGSVPGSRWYLGEGNSYPLQYSSLANSMDRWVW